MDQHILCPHCHSEISVTSTLTAQIREQLQAESEQKINALTTKIEQERSLLLQQQVAVKKQQDSLAQTLQKEKEVMWQKAQIVAQQKAEESSKKKIEALEAENRKKAEALRQAEEFELKLRKQAQEIEERSAKLELEVQRKIDEERKRITEHVKKISDDEHRLKVSEKEKQIEMMRETIEDLKRKSEQGSMQIQGEVQEEDLKLLIKTHFPHDEVSDVEKGIRGADLIHIVRSPYGQVLGKILWESKNTKAWSQQWVTKLKDDQTAVKASVCILVSGVLPVGVTGFGMVDRVWVVSPQFVLPLVHAMRTHMQQLFQVQSSQEGKEEKMELLYSYLSGSEFRSRIENIVQAFQSMKEELEREKRAFERIWKKREQEIDRVILNTSGMYGDLQGIIGAQLQTVPSLELEEGLNMLEET